MDKIDPRYDSYVQIYNNLDGLLWKVPSILLGGSAVIIALIGSIVSKHNLENWFMSMPIILWIGISFFSGIAFVIAGISTDRISSHRNNLGEHLREMEDNGFFHYRHKSNDSSSCVSFTRLCSIFYTLIGSALILVSIFLIMDIFELFKLQLSG